MRLLETTLLLLLSTFLAVSQIYAKSPDCYVSASATSGGDGASSWDLAYQELPMALADARCKEIWVARGVYKPTSTTDPTISFGIKPGTILLGGFAGSELTKGARDPQKNQTILSGDIGNDDANSGGDQIDRTSADIRGKNSFHVLWLDGTLGAGIVATTLVDGFVITGGYASGERSPDETNGGALYCAAEGSGSECSPTLANLTITGNSAQLYGGGIYNDAHVGGTSSPTFTNVVFSGNTAQYGGAVFNDATDGGTSSPKFTSVSFVKNTAGFGGGAIANWDKLGMSNPDIRETTFTENSAYQLGGAILTFVSGTSTLTITNSTFVRNRALDGGAILTTVEDGIARSEIRNATFINNIASFGGAIYDTLVHSGASANDSILNNVILWNNTDTTGDSGIYTFDGTVSIDHSVLQHGCPIGGTCTSLITDDPLLGDLSDHGGGTWTLMPALSSPVVDAGNDGTCPTSDQRGIARPQGAHCDIGAVEVRPSEDVIFRDNFESF